MSKNEKQNELKNTLNYFTSKDIQDENYLITRDFQNETYNYMNENEKVENENIAKFLKEVARISRISYNQGKKLFNIMKEKYLKFKGSKISIDNENSKKNFSSWVKNCEKKMEKNMKIY